MTSLTGLTGMGGMWKTLKEIDLSAIARAAEAPFRIAVLGRPGVGKSALAQQMRIDPRSGEASLASGLGEYELPLTDEIADALKGTDVAVLVVDATSADFSVEHAAFVALARRLVPVVIAYNKADVAADPASVLSSAGRWAPAPVVATAATDRAAVERVLVPPLLRLLAGKELAVARALPIFRAAVVRELIEDTAFTNAAYSFTTGLAEIVPILDVPLNLGDMIMLTKNQGLMAFKIALAMGMSRDWRETVPQLGAVVGAGFLWRQLGRSLVGLIPGWGIVPKVGIAYAGTIVVGQTVYHWAATGEKLKPAALRETYLQAIERGREFARTLLQRQRERRALATAAREESDKRKKGHCTRCGRRLPRGAAWCPACGQAAGAPPALPAENLSGAGAPPGLGGEL